MVLCCLRSFTAVAEDGNPNVKIEYDPLELLDLLKRDFTHMNRVRERAGMFDQSIEARTNALFAFFGLPTGDDLPG